MLPKVIGGSGRAFGVHLLSSFESRGVVRSSLFLCAALPVIFSAGPFLTFRLRFALAAFAFLDITILRYPDSFDNPAGQLAFIRSPWSRLALPGSSP